MAMKGPRSVREQEEQDKEEEKAILTPVEEEQPRR